MSRILTTHALKRRQQRILSQGDIELVIKRGEAIPQKNGRVKYVISKRVAWKFPELKDLRGATVIAAYPSNIVITVYRD